MVSYTDKEEYFWDSQWEDLPVLHFLHPLPTHTLDTVTLEKSFILFVFSFQFFVPFEWLLSLGA